MLHGLALTVFVETPSAAGSTRLALPAHDVKDWGPRHAIVVFLDSPARCTINIKASF